MKIYLSSRKAVQLSRTSLNSSRNSSSKSVQIQLSRSTANRWQMANQSMGLKPPSSHPIRSYPQATWSSNRWHSKTSSKSRHPLTVWNNFKCPGSHPLYSSTISNSRIMATVASSWRRRCKLLYLQANSRRNSSRCPEPLSSLRIWWSSTEAILWCNICAEILPFYESTTAFNWWWDIQNRTIQTRSTTSDKTSNIMVHILILSVAQQWTSICQSALKSFSNLSSC